jgi:hypothetical protein
VWIGSIALSLTAGILAWAIRESPESDNEPIAPAVAPAAQ